MANKKTFKALIKKGLTGMEAARLILQDNWLVDNQRDGFLSDSDIQAIRQAIITEEIGIYNSWIDTYRAVWFTLFDLKRLSLTVINRMLTVIPVIYEYYQEALLSEFKKTAPKVVTQAQYERIKAELEERAAPARKAQKAALLKRIHTLGEVLSDRGYHLASELIDEGGSLSEALEHFRDSNSVGELFEMSPEFWSQTVEPIQQLIREGKLTPVILDEETISRIDDLIGQKPFKPAQNEQDFLSFMRRVHSQTKQENLEEFETSRAIEQQIKELQLAAYKRLREQAGEPERERALALLDRAKQGAADEDEVTLLEYGFVSAQELYEAGLPEWIEEVDTYEPGKVEGLEEPSPDEWERRYAIVQEPHSWMGDKQGDYTDWANRELEQLSKLRLYQEMYSDQEGGLPGILAEVHKIIKQEVREFLAAQVVIKITSDIIDVPFYETIDELYQNILTELERYNRAIELASFAPPDEETRLDLPKLSIARLRPDKEEQEYVERRIGAAMGRENWVEEYEAFVKSRKYAEEDKALARADEVGEFIREALQELEEASDE